MKAELSTPPHDFRPVRVICELESPHLLMILIYLGWQHHSYIIIESIHHIPEKLSKVRSSI